MITLPTNPSDRDLRWFGGLALLLLLGVSLWLEVTQAATGWAVAAAAIGLVVGIIGFVRPRWLRRVYVGWMVVVFPIGWLVAHILLGIVYFGVLTPVGWALRLFGHDPLQRRPNPEATTFWRPRTRERKPSDYFRQF